MDYPPKKLLIGAILLTILLLIVNYITISLSVKYTAGEPKQTLTHQQELWMGILEWCESRGYPDAVNKEDLDGTPSYGAFQFKPTTLWYYAEKFGLDYPKEDEKLGWIVQLPDGSLASKEEALMDYNYQRSVVEQMILHRDQINWNQQFPACVKRFGAPPQD